MPLVLLWGPPGARRFPRRRDHGDRRGGWSRRGWDRGWRTGSASGRDLGGFAEKSGGIWIDSHRSVAIRLGVNQIGFLPAGNCLGRDTKQRRCLGSCEKWFHGKV